MTDLTASGSEAPFAVSMPERAKQVASLYNALDSLAIALEGTRIAVDAVKQAPRLIEYEQLTLNQVLHRWRGTNLLLGRIFEDLYYEGDRIISAIRELMPRG